MDAEFAAQVSGVGALAEPVRRELYRFVASAPEDVSREQAAQALGIALHSAKFHLDRLVDEGLLDVTFRRLSGRSGPGAGRPSKLYRRSDRQLSVSLPERRYDLVGEVLAEAIERANAGDVAVGEAVQDVAQAEGRRIAAAADEAARPEDTGTRAPTSNGWLGCWSGTATSRGCRTAPSGWRTAPSTGWPGPTPSWSAPSTTR